MPLFKTLMDKSRQIRGVLWQNVRIHSDGSGQICDFCISHNRCAKFTAYSQWHW